jgi:hypothetical protein
MISARSVVHFVGKGCDLILYKKNLVANCYKVSVVIDRGKLKRWLGGR